MKEPEPEKVGAHSRRTFLKSLGTVPATTATLPVAVQLAPEAAEQDKAVPNIFPGEPCRSVTVIGFDCSENTVSVAAVQPVGTQVNTDWSSFTLAFGLFTE